MTAESNETMTFCKVSIEITYSLIDPMETEEGRAKWFKMMERQILKEELARRPIEGRFGGDTVVTVTVCPMPENWEE